MRRNAELDIAQESHGIYIPYAQDYLPDAYARNANLAFDAQPTLVTVSNSGIPAWMTNYVDPNLIRVLTAPLKAAEILGEARKGDWLDETATFTVVESTGEVSSYGDYSNNGSSGANVNFPQRQSYLYQTLTQWGERELERAGRAKIGWAAEQNTASAKALNTYQNLTYFFGVENLQNYGLLNDPNLSAPIQPGPKAFGSNANGPWITNGVVTATALEVFKDVQSLWIRLVNQTNGLVDANSALKLVTSNVSALALTATNEFGLTVKGALKEVFPNLTFDTAPQYDTAAGELVQLIAAEVEGQSTGVCAFNEKMRAHPIITDLSSYRQKKTQGSWGAVITFPAGISQMLGV